MKFNITIVSLLILFLTACVDPYRVTIQANQSYLVVDGTLTNLQEPQLIRIYKTEGNTRYVSSEYSATISPVANSTSPISNANVIVLENESQGYSFNEVEPGIYQSPFGFTAKVGNTYKLQFTADGKLYESNPETMIAVPQIDRVYETFNSIGIKSRLVNNVQTPTNDFYIEFKDPATETNYYRWKWIDYELQSFCKTCQQGRLVREGEPAGACEEDRSLATFNFFDYECDAFCWDLIESDGIDIFSDVNANGNEQKGKLIAQIPVFQSNACLVSIRQLSMTPSAYRYYKLASEQAVSSGSLADTPPSPNRSNVFNTTEKSELVLGFFTVSDVFEARLMLERNDGAAAERNGLFRFQKNRAPNLETTDFGRVRIPKARCESSFSRTSDAPRNWQFGL